MSYTLQQSANWIAGFIQGVPTSAWTGSEPILSTASMLQALAVTAPLSYSWNRTEDSTTSTVQGTQDYTVSLTNFGYLEKASLTDSNGMMWEIPDIRNNQPLAKSTTQARPQVISVITTVPGSSATFRLGGIPDAGYTLNLTYQKSAVQFIALSNNWVLPDSMISVYNNLLLGEMLAFADDSRSQLYRTRGIAGLLSFQSGMEEEDKAVFMQQYLNQGAAGISINMGRQQGSQARAAS
jgi:hypothetical protein